MSFLDALPERYRLILCDIWGCVHDGARLYPGAADRLLEWRSQGRCVVLITNAPRTADAVEQLLSSLDLPRGAWDFVVSSGEAGIEALTAIDQPVGFVGTRADRAILEGRGIRIAEADDFRHVAAVGFGDGLWDGEELRADLEGWAGRGVRLHCLNPDRVVVHRGKRLPCAGLIADAYEALGGEVAWYGKPFKPIYDHALARAGGPAPAEVLVIGDGLPTDMLGAARMGFDAVFVTGGIHEGEPFPEGFATENGLDGWRPVAVVSTLG